MARPCLVLPSLVTLSLSVCVCVIRVLIELLVFRTQLDQL